VVKSKLKPGVFQDPQSCGTVLTSLFHVSLSGHCCTCHRVGVVIRLEGGELAVLDLEDEREVAVAGPASRRHVRSSVSAPGSGRLMIARVLPTLPKTVIWGVR
jgi:hypothetical protein